MIRDTHRLLDIQNCVHALIDYLCSDTSPWKSWKAVLGFPEEEIFEQFNKPLIYVLSPVQTDKKRHQAGESLMFYEMIIGLWDDRKTGGEEEIIIMDSYMLDFFANPGTVHASSFNVTTDATYTGTNLITQGIRIRDIGASQEQPTEDKKEFRREFTLSLLA